MPALLVCSLKYFEFSHLSSDSALENRVIPMSLKKIVSGGQTGWWGK